MARNLGTLLERHDLEPGNALGRTALVDLHEGTRTYTYGGLVAAADAFARGLVAAGVGRGERVVILSANRQEMLAALFGCLRAGVVPVPVNFRLPEATLRLIVADSGPRMVFCDAARAGAAAGMGVPVVSFDGADYGRFLAPGTFDPVPVEDGDTALVLYTSGSTGRPKGVLLTHDGQYWASTAYDGARDAIASMRLLTAAPLYHMNALFTAQFAFAANATLVLLPRFEARTFADAIERHRIDYVSGVPTMFARMAANADVAGRRFPDVRVVGLGSAPLTRAVADEVALLFPNATVSNGYGTTEAGPAVFGPHPEGIAKPELALGYPLPEVEIRLLRGPHSDEGVLVLRSPALTKGYHNLAKRTRERIVDGWYDTGDVVRRDAAGFFYFVGREDDMFVCSGENVYPGEVEKLLAGHPEILDCAVVPLADHVRGAVPVAFVVRRAGGGLDVDAVQAYALEHGPPYQYPRRVHFLDALPLTGVDKVDRAKLRGLAEADGRDG
ncbi:MAG: class I adenylate-forming enzyme family protein [Gammaproteobacteria bacterium]|nr:class I adenylate-forming enzyme family protein [Gammaproteobacteria bacterium]